MEAAARVANSGSAEQRFRKADKEPGISISLLPEVLAGPFPLGAPPERRPGANTAGATQCSASEVPLGVPPEQHPGSNIAGATRCSEGEEPASGAGATDDLRDASKWSMSATILSIGPKSN